MTTRSLIDVIPLESRGEVTIPGSFIESLNGNSRVAIYVRSRDDVVIKAYDKIDGEKVFNAYLEITKNEMRSVVKFISENIPTERIVWTSGFCVPESGGKMFSDYDACMWQGVVKFPSTMTIDDVKLFFKRINIDQDKRIVTMTNVEEV